MTTPIDTALDVVGSPIFYLEHVNFEHDRADATQAFYQHVLQLTPDTGKTAMRDTTVWLNVGHHSQIHLPLEHRSTHIDGAVGLVLGADQCAGLAARAKQYRAVIGTDSRYQYQPFVDGDGVIQSLVTNGYELSDAGHFHRLVDPYGSQFRVHSLSNNDINQRGIAYLLIQCPPSALPHIANYWQSYFRVEAKLHDSNHLVIKINQRQHLIFRGKDDALVKPLWHLAFYISDFSGVYQRLLTDGLVANIGNRSDSDMDDWTSVKQSKQFRALVVRDNDGNEVFSLELEIRSAQHQHFDRTLAIDE